MAMRSHDWKRLLVPGLVALVLGASSGVAAAQGTGGPVGIDHYKVYRLLPPIPSLHPVLLRDQFMQVNHVAREFAYFSTPVMKNGEPIFDPVTHYDWWRIDPVPFPGLVFATNQFGPDQPLKLRQSEFLLLPSLKFPQPGQVLPPRQHYQCYAVEGPAPNQLVSLQDQFGPNEAFVDSARFFCNPVEKQDENGLFPITDPEAHLVCYRIVKTPPNPPITVLAQDQFGFWQSVLADAEYLCVPSFKTGVVPTQDHSWGRVKSIYR